MLYCYVYITGWDYNLFIWQLYNILLCDYTVIIHTPMPLTFCQKKSWKRLLSGFTVINSDVYVCVCPLLKFGLCTSISHHSILQPMLCVTFQRAFLKLAPWLEFRGVPQSNRGPASQRTIWKSNMTLSGKGKKYQKWRENNGGCKQNKLVSTLKSLWVFNTIYHEFEEKQS